MFTGIVEQLGKIKTIERQQESVRLTIWAPGIAEDVRLGESVAVNGVCLTVTDIDVPHIAFDAVYETMRKTTLGALLEHDPVNLERSLPMGGRLGGHIVQGHVDGTGRIASIRPVGNSWFVYVDAAPELMRYVVTKGSVAVDGVSLTVAEAEDRTFALSIIPHTWEHTNLQHKRAGDMVNIECDILGKYVERLLDGYVGGGAGRTPNAALGRANEEQTRRYNDEQADLGRDLLARSGYVAAETEPDTW
jgi:riboflavin synthase